MARLFQMTDGCREGKYLVVRRDCTIPAWNWFVLGSRDPIAPWALRFYAVVAFLMRKDWAYVKDVWGLAGAFARYRKLHGSGDPDAPRHREDHPVIVGAMRQRDWFVSAVTVASEPLVP